jgi:hypothetical protein
MVVSQSENIFAFKYRGYPLYCPHCQMNVNLNLPKYKSHFELNPSTCMHCKRVWEVEGNKWIEEAVKINGNTEVDDNQIQTGKYAIITHFKNKR